MAPTTAMMAMTQLKKQVQKICTAGTAVVIRMDRDSSGQIRNL
jgi:hypothetical protein